MLIYAVLGTCNQLSVGAEAALCLLVGNAIDEIWADVVAEHRHRHREILETEQVRVAVDVATMLAFQVRRADWQRSGATALTIPTPRAGRHHHLCARSLPARLP